ncbi:hypothetical protein [Azotobacter salinestris]|uniref:hypothetical protein n=1 Tax=Azotobacter salinestris TaxID=69964 RepID=UPI0032DE856B
MEMLEDESSIKLCPAIYQEKILGCRHLRVNIFGSSVYAFEIRSDMMDWRRKLTKQIYHVNLPLDISEALLSIKNKLGLHLSVFDLKYDETGELVFLELNPQGQYLFIEGLNGFPLNEKMVDFLLKVGN